MKDVDLGPPGGDPAVLLQILPQPAGSAGTPCPERRRPDTVAAELVQVLGRAKGWRRTCTAVRSRREMLASPVRRSGLVTTNAMALVRPAMSRSRRAGVESARPRHATPVDQPSTVPGRGPCCTWWPWPRPPNKPRPAGAPFLPGTRSPASAEDEDTEKKNVAGPTSLVR